MTILEGSNLIKILKEENKIANKEDKKFNLQWIKCIEKSISSALKKVNYI